MLTIMCQVNYFGSVRTGMELEPRGVNDVLWHNQIPPAGFSRATIGSIRGRFLQKKNIKVRSRECLQLAP
jgi:hypothetical protein